MALSDRIGEDEKKRLRAAFDGQHTAAKTLADVQRELAVAYELRGKDEMDQFGFITRDPSLAR